MLRTIARLGLLAVCMLAGVSCRNVSRFSTGSGHYEGAVVSGDFVRFNVPDQTRMCLTLDVDHFQDTPGIVSSSDGRFTATALRQIPQIWHDPLSTLSFGEGRERNMVYMLAPQASDPLEQADVTVFLSLMDSGDVEVRLVRGAPPSKAGAPSAIFGVFVLTQASGACPF